MTSTPVDALYDSNINNQRTGLSTYRQKLAIANQGTEVENEVANHDQLLTQVNGNAAAYADIVNQISGSAILDANGIEDQAMKKFQLQSSRDKYKNRYQLASQKISLTDTSQKALNAAIKRTDVILDSMKNIEYEDKKQNHNKERLIYIQQEAARDKQNTIQRLSILIYLLIYALGLGVAMAMGILRAETLGYAALIGALVALFFALTTGSFFKSYGELSEKIAKAAVKEIVWEKKCPKKCRRKTKDDVLTPLDEEDDSTATTTLSQLSGYSNRQDQRLYQPVLLEADVGRR